MSKTLVSVALWALIGWLLGAWLGADIGWALVALWLLALVLVSGPQLSRVSKWAKNIDEPPPPSVGPWDAIIAPIYRTLKRHRMELLERHPSFHRPPLAAPAP